MSDQRLTPRIQIGDYFLKELIYEGESIRTWLAQQISVQREVIIDSLNRALHSDETAVANFLSDIRAKARLDHPLIGSVFEAIHENGICAYARERLSGATLETILETGTLLSPREIVHILRQIAEANLYLEKNNIASLPLQPHQIFFGDKYLTRMVNMAIGGERDHSISTIDKNMLGHAFLGLIQPGHPGATRTTSLLTFMADEEREIPLTWEQVRELSGGVERQLTEPNHSSLLESQTAPMEQDKDSKTMIRTAGIVAAAVTLVGVLAFILYAKDNAPDRARETDTMVEIPSGRYLSHDGQKSEIRAFAIDAHEVSIAQYKVFLDYLETAQELGSADSFDSDEQPEEKQNHIPSDWDAMYNAARKNDSWTYLEGSSPIELKLDLNSPVINVDWYDAYAYAEWKRHRLPSQEEWYAAIMASGSELRSLKPSQYGPVDQTSEDITSNEIYGLAGNVAEWTRKKGRNPALPAMPKRPILCGGSYLRNKLNGAIAREWIESRLERRPDLGFRTVKDITSN